MHDVLAEIESWRAKGEDVALAVVVRTWGSAPRGVGAKMGITASGLMAGSVSGGCVESAVALAGKGVLATGRPSLLQLGVADESAWALGLSCGGKIEVFVAPLQDAILDGIREALAARRPLATATIIAGPEALLGRSVLVRGSTLEGSLGAALDEEVILSAREALVLGQSRRAVIGEAEVFVDVLPPPSQLVMVGGVHVAVHLDALARTLGYRTTVVDPREAFANATRFPNVGRVLNRWPDDGLRELGIDGATAVAVLTHDPKLDDPALKIALESPAFYVGALGGRATREKRRIRLLEAGLSEERLERLYAPIGLDLGARSPEEIALSVMAQVVAARNGRAPQRD